MIVSMPLELKYRCRKNWSSLSFLIVALSYLVIITGCSIFEDPATSIAYDIERGVKRFENKEDTTYVVTHSLKKRAKANVKTITIQFNMKDGGLGTLCKDSEGKLIQASATRYHCRFVEIPKSLSVTKSIDSQLNIELAKRGEKIVVKAIY
jgi:hypothetical protein